MSSPSGSRGSPRASKTTKGHLASLEDRSFHTPEQSSGKSSTSSHSTTSSGSRPSVAASKASKGYSSASTDRIFHTPEGSPPTPSSSSGPGRRMETWSSTPTTGQPRPGGATGVSPRTLDIENVCNALHYSKSKLIFYEAQLDANPHNEDTAQLRQRVRAQQEDVDELARQFENILRQEEKPTGEISYHQKIRDILQKYQDPGRRIAIFRKDLAAMVAYQEEKGGDKCIEAIRQLQDAIRDQETQMTGTTRRVR